NNGGAARPYNNNNNNGGAARPYNNNNNGGAARPYNNNNNGGAARPYNNNNNGGTARPYNNNNNGGAARPYNNNNNGGAARPYNNNNNGGAARPYNNNNNGGTARPYNNNNNNGGAARPYNNNRPAGAQGQNSGQRYGNSSSFAKQRADFDKPRYETAKPLDKTAQRKNDKSKRPFDRNRSNKYREKDISILKKDPNRKGAFIKPQPVMVEKEPDDGIKTVMISEIITIRDLADKMKLPAASIVKKLFLEGKMYSINQEIAFEEAEEIALEYNYIVELEEKVDVIEEILKEDEENEEEMVKRPPVVCVMGHVDHGKTSLLDAIRETHVTEKEAGGITQHIGAYMVEAGGQLVTFLDTPGHEAFTSMRMRGAKSTDIAILVVAADDGVMPQTVEAINHAKAAEVEIIVAINKIDKPGANVERVKQELVEYELIAEDWGGSTVFVPVSAKTGDGIDQLLEMIILTSEVLELKANPERLARGIVIEAQLDKGRGPVATILVQKGTLHVGDSIVIGSSYGKVRAMMDEKGRRLKEAKPSTPVEILGLNEVPDAGEIFMSTENDKEARSIASAYIKQGREKLLADTKAKLSLDGLFSQIQAGNIKELNLIVKADVQGSVEAVKQSLLKLSNEEVAIRIIHGAVGAVNESDVTLASASNAIIIAFNVRPDPTAKETAEREHVDLRLYKVIYNAIEDIEAAMKGMLDPIFEEKIIGHAEIRQVFKASKVGNIAGSYVLDGKIVRDSKVRITRDDAMIFEGELSSLKRFKDDVKEVAAGYECGLVFDKFDSVQEEDKVEVYVMEEISR
ncbi:MAG: translation initiation factor IF-2, partial [Velocimicrobium sp.]